MTAGDQPRTEDLPRVPPKAGGPSPVPAKAGDRRLEAPHRRGGATPRVVERLAVAGYRALSWVLANVPPSIAANLVGRASQASYLAWPTKRRWSNRNFGHVLGLPPDHERVRSMAMRAYYGYGHYLVELMRLPTRTPEQLAAMVPDMDADDVNRLRREAPNGGGLIFVVGHVGSNDAVAAAIARHGLPISVVADDSAFPEIFELLRGQREAWGVKIIAWRNLRAIFGVLRRREMLGLLVDWGYRSDGIPVKLFGQWTALPAGPATLAAKTGSRILPITVRRRPDQTYLVTWPGPIDLSSDDPAELWRATQAIADALASTIAAAPEQWYSFKPIWPSTPEEAADLERRATLMQSGIADPGPAPEFA